MRQHFMTALALTETIKLKLRSRAKELHKLQSAFSREVAIPH
jgi:hypothetical protein